MVTDEKILRQVSTTSVATSSVLQEEKRDASCQSSATKRSSISTQISHVSRVEEELTMKIAIREMELDHRDKVQKIRKQLDQERGTTRSINTRYVAARAQNEYLDNLLIVANSRIDSLNTRLEAATSDTRSPSMLQQ